MSIENKNRETVPYKLNPIQEDINKNSSGRDIYVKPAQVGFTTDTILDFLIDCITIPGTTSVVISYDEFITGRILRKAHAFYRVLQQKIPSIDKLVHKSTAEMTFDKLGSSIYISSARSFAGVRGEVIHNLLLDEFAFWSSTDIEKIMSSAINRVPLLPNTKIRVGSTPNGMDNGFYEMYEAAKEGKNTGASVFKPHFYPWFAHPEYSMTADSPVVLPDDDTAVLSKIQPDEQILLNRFKALRFSEEESHNKIRWRRYKIAEASSLQRSGKTKLLFAQEFPEDDVSCFLSAGDMVYDAQVVADKARECYPAPIHLLFADIWEPPQPGTHYLLAIDPGAGHVSESVGTVWNFSGNQFKHVATLSGYYEGDEMADKSMTLARYYNGATIANEDALEFNTHIKGYEALYYRTDVVSGIVSNKIGWATTGVTKPYMISELNRHISQIDCNDIRVWSQMRNIRWVQGARGARAISVGADDYHDSACIALVCRESVPVERGIVGSYGWSDSWGQ